MPRRAARPPAADAAEGDLEQQAPAPANDKPTPAAQAAMGTLADLPVAGLTRRRIALLIGALAAAWIIVFFARQVGEASAASTRADAMRASNASLEVSVAALERELDLIQRQAYIEQQARTYRLGSAAEIPFVLSADAPSLAPDAPGMPSVQLGAVTDRPTPLESWLDLLFGARKEPAR